MSDLLERFMSWVDTSLQGDRMGRKVAAGAILLLVVLMAAGFANCILDATGTNVP